MKKTFFVLLVLVLVSSTSFAAITWPTSDGGDAVGHLRTGQGVTIVDAHGGGPTINVTLSPNVGIQYNADTTAPAGENYSIVTVNAQGTRMYGIASDFSGIYYSDFGSGNLATATIPTAVDSSTAFSGWDEVGK